MATIDDEIDISDVLYKINEESYADIIENACTLLSLAGTVNGEHYPPSRILFDLLEGTSYDEVKEAMERDYERVNRR